MYKRIGNEGKRKKTIHDAERDDYGLLKSARKGFSKRNQKKSDWRNGKRVSRLDDALARTNRRGVGHRGGVTPAVLGFQSSISEIRLIISNNL